MILYDFEYRDCSGPELDFWDLLASQSAAPVLELAVGTGGIALPLARLGHEVWGIDTSEADACSSQEQDLENAGICRRQGYISYHSQCLHSVFPLDSASSTHRSTRSCSWIPSAKRQPVSSARTRTSNLVGNWLIDAFAPGPDDFLPDVEELTYLERHPETGALVTRRRQYEFDSTNDVAISHITYTLESDSKIIEKYHFRYIPPSIFPGATLDVYE